MLSTTENFAHPSRSYWRMRSGIIPKDPEQYIDLLHMKDVDVAEVKKSDFGE